MHFNTFSDETAEGLALEFRLEAELATNGDARKRNALYREAVARELARTSLMSRAAIVRTLMAHNPAYVEEVLTKEEFGLLRSRYARTFCWEKNATWRDEFEISVNPLLPAPTIRIDDQDRHSSP